MKLAFTTLGCPDWNLDTVIARAREYGFDGVDFRGCSGELDIWKLPEFSTYLRDTAKRLRSARLEVPCISSSARLLADDDEKCAKSMDNLVQSVKVGGALGAALVRVFGGFLGPRSPEHALREAAAALDTMAREAAPLGISVLVETHDDWVTGGRLRALMDAASQPNVGVIWDVNHPLRKGGESPEATWEACGRYVRYTHFKDTRLAPDGKTTVFHLVGEGDLPLRQIIDVLRRGGYDGWLTLEWEKKWHPELADPEVVFPHYVRFMRTLLG